METGTRGNLRPRAQRLELTRNFCGHGRKVVAIEPDEENDRIEAAREAGAIVLIGDGSDLILLQRSGISRASQLLIVTGDDGKNVEIALRVEQLLQQQSRGFISSHCAAEETPRGRDTSLATAPHDAASSSESAASLAVADATGDKGREMLDCIVHIVDPELRALFRRHRVFREMRARLKVTVHDFYEDSARRLFRDHPLDREPIASVDDLRRVRVVIVGFGQMGENVLLQASRIGHFANGLKLLATIIDPRAKRLQRVFEHRFPRLKHVCEAEFLDLEVEEPLLIERLGEWGRDPSTVETFILCCDNDSRNLSIALHLLPHLQRFGIPLLARMSSRSGLASMLESLGADAKGIGRIKPFGMVEEMCSLELLTKGDLDRLARAIHEDYVRRRRAEGASPEDPALRPCEHLDDDFRESCHQQADHLPVKLRAIGCYSASAQTDKGDVSDFSATEIEVFARMEHARWCAERFLAGWTYAPGKKILEAKTSPHLVEYDLLPENVKEYDRQAVRLIPHLVSLVGERVYRQ